MLNGCSSSTVSCHVLPFDPLHRAKSMLRGYIAVDLGAESGRVIVGTLADGKIALQELHRFPHEPVHLPSGYHWNVTALWREILAGLKKAAAWAGEQRVQLVSVGVDTWGVDWALVGKSGELVGLPHAYRDPRNQSAYEQAVDKLGVELIYQTTGIQFMALNTLYSFYAQWNSGPELINAADRLLFMPDLFHYWLSGEIVNEATIASTSQMVDCHTGKWATQLLERLEMPTHFLGRISPPGTPVGTIRPELAAETGLPEDLMVVAVGSHDTASAVAAVPAAQDDDWCYLSSGTWSLLGVELDEPCVSAAAQEAMFTNERGVADKVRFLRNIAGLWLVQQCRRELAKQGQDFDYAELTQQAAQADSFRTLVDPSYGPFQIPGEMLEKIRRFARDSSQPEPETPGQFIRTCLESLALAYRQTLLLLEGILGRRFSTIHIVGGGGQNSLLNQMTAEATDRTVRVGPYEATATGNTLTQAITAGDVDDLDELRQIASNSFDLQEYTPQSPAKWLAAYERFLELVGSVV
jgi:rhamnulokinase